MRKGTSKTAWGALKTMGSHVRDQDRLLAEYMQASQDIGAQDYVDYWYHTSLKPPHAKAASRTNA